MHCVVRGGWVGRSVRWSLFSSSGRDEPFSLFIKYRLIGLPLVLESTTVPTVAHLSFTTLRTVLSYCCPVIIKNENTLQL